MFGTLTQRGWPTEPKNSLASRGVFLFLIMFGSLTFWYWEAMLVSYLSTVKTVLPFSSVSELVRSSNYRIAVRPGSYQLDLFKYSSNSDWADGYTERIQPHLDDYTQYGSLLMNILINDSTTAVYWDYSAGM